MASGSRSESAGVLIRRLLPGLLLLLWGCAPELPRESPAEDEPVVTPSPEAIQRIETAVDSAIADLRPEGFREAAAEDDSSSAAAGLAEPAVAATPVPPPPMTGPEANVSPDHVARTDAGAAVLPLSFPEAVPTFPRPQAVRGIYLNAWAAGSSVRTSRLMALAERTEVNSFVIDLKDASGHVSHPTSIALAREIGADQQIRIRDLPALLRRLEAAGIYPIARIVISKDPLLTEHRPDWAVQDVEGGVWKDEKGVSWANMFEERVWEYNVALAVEAAQLGFPEIQWDYVRFPDGADSVMVRAEYPGAEGRNRPAAVREFLEYAGRKLQPYGVEMTADVFGVTTAARIDLGIGQLWETFIDRVDVALPMVYPSHYGAGSYGFESPNHYPYEVVRAALTDARNRSDSVPGAGRTRPWLQDFTLGSPRYGGPEVRAQIQATYDAGIRDWILWNPSARYSESGLLPADGLPAGIEPTMRVAGRIVPVSQRLDELDGDVLRRIAERRLNPMSFPEPRYLEPPRSWAGRVEDR